MICLSFCGNGHTYLQNSRHPYGRRRVGVNERLGANAQLVAEIYSSFFITWQMYKLN